MPDYKSRKWDKRGKFPLFPSEDPPSALWSEMPCPSSILRNMRLRMRDDAPLGYGSTLGRLERVRYLDQRASRYRNAERYRLAPY